MNGVIMLVNEFPPLPVGGAERQAERLSGYLAARGWPVWVLTRRIGNLPAHETRAGMQIIRPVTRGPGKLQTISFVLGCMQTLWTLRKEYSILHAHLAFGPAFAAALSARLLGKKVIVKLGNSGKFGDILASMATWRGRLRLTVLRRWADIIIALDDTMVSEAISAGFDPQRIVRMNNGIDAMAFAPAENDKIKTESTRQLVNILYVGRLTAQKSLPILLDALTLALPACPALHLTLVGDGEERSTLEAQAARLGIAGNVTFSGAQQDVRPFLRNADIFALPSAAEGISNALLEAMSAGLACLATPVGGNAWVLDQGQCGTILPHGDIQAWSSALTSLGNDPAERLRLGNAARQRILTVFDFSVVGAQYEALYNKLLSIN
jgi:glycosyltransferase involved in cell wall biosynthesis